jgi:hypothetical protein
MYYDDKNKLVELYFLNTPANTTVFAKRKRNCVCAAVALKQGVPSFGWIFSYLVQIS